MTSSERDGHINLEVLPLEGDRWSNLEPMDIEWLKSSISTDEEKLRERMDAIQKEAYACYPYPCIRIYGFARLDAPRHALYRQIIEAGKKGDTVYLDFACCMGTDARKVVADGYPAQNVFACDLRQEFLDYGHRLYDVAATCGIHFLTANAFDIPYPPKGPIVTDLANVKEVGQLRGRVTHLYAGLFFHLFDEAAQYDLALRFGTLVKHESGTVLYGRQMGITEPQDIEDTGMFVHSPESWTQMWKKAFTELENADFAENRVVVKAELVQLTEKNIVKLKTKSELPVLYWSVQIV